MSDTLRVACVAGASGSVGSEISRGLLESGWHVGLLYRSARHQLDLRNRFAKYGDRAMPVQVNATVSSSVQQAIQRIEAEWGALHVLVNAIGGWLGGKRLHEHTDAELNRMLDMDLRPAFHLMQAVLPVMLRQNRGKIIHFVSLTPLYDGAMSAVYAASKAGVIALTRAAAKEYRADGIQVYALAPGTIDTEKNRQAMPDVDRSTWVPVRELVEAALFLAEGGDALSGTVFEFRGVK
ncbi:MAG: SDR family oxidoreductase [candidate division KSB1 bacterium]|nr:SDR family oxidoreductase [candidate division KSB1 bacterium]